MSRARLCVRSTVVLVACVVSSVFPAAQESASASLAAELSELMTTSELEALASKATGDDGRYVAALAFPGQLLVVSARYEVPLYLDEKIVNRQFRDVYIDLNTASIQGTKILVTDVGANGLLADDPGVDIFDDGAGALRLDGVGSGTGYASAVADADEQYAEMLRALIASVR